MLGFQVFWIQAITCPAEQQAGVGDAQKHVVQHALQHGRVHVEVWGQVLGGDGRPADESRQTLTHAQRLGKLPEKEKKEAFSWSYRIQHEEGLKAFFFYLF